MNTPSKYLPVRAAFWSLIIGVAPCTQAPQSPDGDEALVISCGGLLHRVVVVVSAVSSVIVRHQLSADATSDQANGVLVPVQGRCRCCRPLPGMSCRSCGAKSPVRLIRRLDRRLMSRRGSARRWPGRALYRRAAN